MHRFYHLLSHIQFDVVVPEQNIIIFLLLKDFVLKFYIYTLSNKLLEIISNLLHPKSTTLGYRFRLIPQKTLIIICSYFAI